MTEKKEKKMIDKKRSVYTMKKQEKREERTIKTHYLLSMDSPFNAPQRRVFHDSHYLSNLFLQSCSFKKGKILKPVSAIFYQVFIFHQVVALQKLWKNVFYFI